MNGSLRLRSTIARRMRERAGSRRAGRANRADGIAAIVVHIVQAVISAAIALSTSTEHTRARRQLSGWEQERVLALTPLHFDQHMSRFSDAKYTRLYRLAKQDFSSLVAKLHPTLARTHTRPEGSSASVPVPIMVAITVRYLAGGQILDIAWPYGVADSGAFYTNCGEEIWKLETYHRSYAKSLGPCFAGLIISNCFLFRFRWGRASAPPNENETGNVIHNIFGDGHVAERLQPTMITAPSKLCGNLSHTLVSAV
jgi:hypothetical protein